MLMDSSKKVKPTKKLKARKDQIKEDDSNKKQSQKVEPKCYGPKRRILLSSQI